MTEEHSSLAVVPSSFLRSRTAADALEELNRYKEIRESILNRGKGQPQDTSEDKPTGGDP
jgi:autophagy-related protein 13